MIDRIQQLQRQIATLTQIRNHQVAIGRRQISAANKEFDDAALPLMRELNRLQADQPKPTPARKGSVSRRTVEAYVEGLSKEDAQHFRELLSKKGS